MTSLSAVYYLVSLHQKCQNRHLTYTLLGHSEKAKVIYFYLTSTGISHYSVLSSCAVHCTKKSLRHCFFKLYFVHDYNTHIILVCFGITCDGVPNGELYAQRFQKSILSAFLTDCFMKISLQLSEQKHVVFVPTVREKSS